MRYAYKKNNLPFDDQIRIIKQKHGETLDDVVLNNILSKKLPIKNQKFDPSFDSKYEEWSVSILGKKPLHPTRFRTNIPYGTYFHFPSLLGFNKVVKMPTSLQSKELKLLTVLAKYDSDAETQKEILDKLNKENKPEYLIPENNTKNLNEKYKNFCSVGIGIAVMYSIENVTKSYRKLYELESVYQSYALTVLSNMSRGKNLGDFYTKSFISELEINLYETLNDIPRKQWGIHTYRVGFNRIGIHKMNMTLQELSSDGLYVNLSNTPANKNDVDE